MCKTKLKVLKGKVGENEIKIARENLGNPFPPKTKCLGTEGAGEPLPLKAIFWSLQNCLLPPPNPQASALQTASVGKLELVPTKSGVDGMEIPGMF